MKRLTQNPAYRSYNASAYMRPGGEIRRGAMLENIRFTRHFNRQTRQPKQRRDAQVKQTPGKVMLGL